MSFFSILRVLKKSFIAILAFWLLAIVLFSVLPVPYSTVMLQKQLTALGQGDLSYRARQTWVATEDISPYMFLAVIASEDQNFVSHWGFDFAAIETALSSGSRGASTISQQTAKNLLLWSGRSWLRKGLEAGITVGLEVIWSKKRIITVYLNIAEFGNGIFGVEQAARRFFSKSAKQLTMSEAALLAAVLPNPIQYKVNRPSQYVLSRQRWVIKQMNQLGHLKAIDELLK